MKISYLNLLNFRNYDQLELNFSEGIHLFIGENAQGKTNILESLYLLGTTRSFRRAEDQKLIKYNHDITRIDAKIEKKSLQKDIKIIISQNKNKILFINNKKVQKLSNYIGNLNITLFSPEDLFIIKGEASLRRRFIDGLLCQTDPEYLSLLIDFQKTLKHRNILLKESKRDRKKLKTIDVWDEKLIIKSVEIMKKRDVFIIKISNLATEIHNKLTNKETLTLEYVKSIDTKQENMLEVFYSQLKQVREQEISRGSTLLGPHRDEMEILLDGRPARYFGSQGQQRTIAIALRMAEVEYIQLEVSEYPVLLLDDIFSELDEKRREALCAFLEQRQQLFITGTRLLDFKPLSEHARIFSVTNGKVTE